jgi:hypothetical protein
MLGWYVQDNSPIKKLTHQIITALATMEQLFNLHHSLSCTKETLAQAVSCWNRVHPEDEKVPDWYRDTLLDKKFIGDKESISWEVYSVLKDAAATKYGDSYRLNWDIRCAKQFCSEAESVVYKQDITIKLFSLAPHCPYRHNMLQMRNWTRTRHTNNCKCCALIYIWLAYGIVDEDTDREVKESNKEKYDILQTQILEKREELEKLLLIEREINMILTFAKYLSERYLSVEYRFKSDMGSDVRASFSISDENGEYSVTLEDIYQSIVVTKLEKSYLKTSEEYYGRDNHQT